MVNFYGNANLKAGELVAFTEGEYSSYEIEGHYKILQDCDLDYLLECHQASYIEECTATYPEGYKYRKLNGPKFSVWLEQKGYIEPIVVKEAWFCRNWNDIVSAVQVR